jgi:GT2 family glycosyltransferase
VPGYRRETPCLAVTLAQKAEVEGMGACMAVRRDVAIELGGFDEWLGAGSHYRAGEDVDFTLRLLAAGHWVFETPAVSVVHEGFHSWAQAPALVQSYWLGAGAALGKHLRKHPVSGLTLLAKLGYRFVVSRSRVAASLGPAGSAAARLLAFARGLAAGAARPVDGTHGLFRAWRAAGERQPGIEITTPGSAIDMPPGAQQSPDRSRISA